MRTDMNTGALIIEKAGSRIAQIVLMVCLVFSVIGCKSKSDDYTMTFEKIDNLLFTKAEYIKLITEPSSIRALNDQEIIILRRSIRNATDLIELDDREMPKIDIKQEIIVAFIIKWDDGWSTNLFYDRMNHHMYIYKDQVRFRDKTKYRNLTPEIYNRIMLGIFRFRPSDDIDKLFPGD